MSKLIPQNFRVCLSAAVFALWQLSAHGMPKAAETEDEPVVISSDVAKPKAVAKPAKKEVRKKSPQAAKAAPHKQASAPKSPRTKSAKK